MKQIEKKLLLVCEENEKNCAVCPEAKLCNDYCNKAVKNAIFEGNNNSYIINGKDLNSIRGIEALNFEECTILANKLLNSSIEEINGHTVFFIDFNGYFGYSALVFLNGSHLYYADDFQLHHKINYSSEEATPHTIETLKAYYMECLPHKIFSADQLSNADNYLDFKAKEHYIRNYFPMMFDKLSIFAIEGTPEAKKFEDSKNDYPYYSDVCFSYFKDKYHVEVLENFLNTLKASYNNILSDPEKFKKAISYELANHEACITMEYRDALSSIGLSFKRLEVWQQNIVLQELDRQIRAYGNGEAI